MNPKEALHELSQAVQALALAQIERNRAKEVLELSRATALLSGALTGKNAEEREAQARTTLAQEYDHLSRAEENLIRARARAEIARAALDVSLHKEER